jgi:hypothetical protein
MIHFWRIAPSFDLAPALRLIQLFIHAALAGTIMRRVFVTRQAFFLERHRAERARRIWTERSVAFLPDSVDDRRVSGEIMTKQPRRPCLCNDLHLSVQTYLDFGRAAWKKDLNHACRDLEIPKVQNFNPLALREL